MVNMENIEEYMLLYADGELNAEEEKALLAFVALHPELETDLKAYAATRLVPDEGIIFEHKDSLLKTAGPARRIALGNWKMYAAAACVLLVAVLFTINRRGTDIEEAVAVNETLTGEDVTQPQVPTIEPIKNDTAVDVVPLQKKIHSTSPVNTIAVNTAAVKQRQKPSGVRQQDVVIKQESIAAHSNRDTVVQPTATNNKTMIVDANPTTEETPQVPKSYEPMQEKKPNRAARFLANVLGEKPEGLTAFEDAMDEKLMAVKEFSKEVKDTEVKLRLGKKELTIVRF